MSPRGDVQAYAADFYSKMDWDWQCKGLQVFAQIEGNRYTVNGSIPLESLRNLKVCAAMKFTLGLLPC